MNEQTKRVFTNKQMALIEKYRGWNVNDGVEWWECVYADWVEKLKALGIEVGSKRRGRMGGYPTYEYAIHFSGFWSQGDGACFEGQLDMKKFIDAHSLAGDYPAAAFFAKATDFNCWISQKGSYYHSGSVQFEFEVHADYIEDEPVREAIREQMEWKLDNEEWNEFEEAVEEICRGYMDDIYEALELEYDYLTSDEVVWEAIEANELDKEIEDDEEDEEVLAHAA